MAEAVKIGYHKMRTTKQHATLRLEGLSALLHVHALLLISPWSRAPSPLSQSGAGLRHRYDVSKVPQ
jgi:hypothetical protein